MTVFDYLAVVNVDLNCLELEKQTQTLLSDFFNKEFEKKHNIISLGVDMPQIDNFDNGSE